MQNKLISIGKTAKLLGVSIDTLRRWDLSGSLRSIRSGPRGHRYYRQSDVEQYLQDVDVTGRSWAQSSQAVEPKPEVYCQTRDVFQARLETLQAGLSRISPLTTVSLVTAIAGEIGNNSFDHNLGNWPDVSGIFFAYSMRTGKVVLADRGLGILATLKRVRPELTGADEALKTAFTETISGRFPEARGNGLKFVRSIIINNPFALYLQTGNACLYLKQHDKNIVIQRAEIPIRGCFAIIGFENLL